MRKDNYAIRVIQITPHCRAAIGGVGGYYAHSNAHRQVDEIDIWRLEAYFCLRIRCGLSDGKGGLPKILRRSPGSAGVAVEV